MSFPKTPTFTPLASPSPIRAAAFPLIAKRGDRLESVGTATLIHPSLAITARHVVDEFSRLFDDALPLEGSREATFALTLPVVGYALGAQAYAYFVRKIWGHEASDIALLWLGFATDVPADVRPVAPKLDLMPPAVGERVAAFGYPRTALARDSDGDIQVDLSPHTTVGEVTEIYPRQRDQSMIRFPTYQVNARFDGGMSGGPVFNDQGHLCGIVCAGTTFDGDQADEGHVSYASTLWPLAGLPIDLPIENPPPIPYFVRHLFERKVIVGFGWEDLQIIMEAGRETGLGVPGAWKHGRAERVTSE